MRTPNYVFKTVKCRECSKMFKTQLSFVSDSGKYGTIEANQICQSCIVAKAGEKIYPPPANSKNILRLN